MYFLFISLFTITEVALLVAKRSRRSVVKSRNDRKSLLILWITIPASLTIGHFISLHHIWLSGPPNTLEIAGITLYVAGFLERWLAIYQLGRMFTVDVSISSDHMLKTNGLYSVVRHPSYLGLLLIIAGLSLLLNNLVACFIVVPIFAAILYRISVEEDALKIEFGSRYALYVKNVRKIIPFIY